MVQNPFNGTGTSPTPESQAETRFTYFPTVSVGAGDVGTTHTEVTNALAGQAGKEHVTSVAYIGPDKEILFA